MKDPKMSIAPVDLDSKLIGRVTSSIAVLDAIFVVNMSDFSHVSG